MVDGWTYQGIEIRYDEEPAWLLNRLIRLENAFGLSLGFQAVGLFWASMTKSRPPRFSGKGEPRRFLHVTWQEDPPLAWSIISHVGERDQRALLSAFSGAGFLARDIDVDGHPRESALLSAFLSNAEDFNVPIESPRPDPERLKTAWLQRVTEIATSLRYSGESQPQRVDEAEWLVKNRRVRFEHGWYLSSGPWRSRYLVQMEDGSFSLAGAQESLCTCSSQRPETLQLMMPSDHCIHHLAAQIIDGVAEAAFVELDASVNK